MASDSQSVVHVKEEKSRSFHFVLVHGACFGAWCWYKVADLLIKACHTVSSLDMASGGIHPADADKITTLEEYNQPLTDFFTALPSQEKVILVGHSSGGYNLSFTMERFPHKIAAAVFVTAIMSPSGITLSDTLKEIVSRIGNFGDSTFYYANGEENPPTSIKLGKQFSKDFLLQNSPSWDITSTNLLLKKFPLWEGAVLYTNENYGRVPRAYVVTKEDRSVVEEMQRKMIADNPPQMVYEIEGSDHSPFFCKPEELAQILLQISNTCGHGSKGREIEKLPFRVGAWSMLWCLVSVGSCRFANKSRSYYFFLDMASGGIHPADADNITTLEEYNQPLTDFVSALPSQDKVILVGHSGGGYNLSFTMERFPHKIAASVFVAAFMPLSGTTLYIEFPATLSTQRSVPSWRLHNIARDLLRESDRTAISKGH